MLGALAILVGVLAVLGLQPREDAKQVADPSPKFAAELWQKRTFGKLSLEAPFKFVPEIDVSRSKFAELEATLVSFQSYSSEEAPESFHVNVVRVEYRPGVPLQPEQALRSGFLRAAAEFEDLQPEILLDSVQVSGHKALRGSYRRAGEPFDVSMNGTTIEDAPVLWHVTVIFGHNDNRPDAERILKSLTLED